MPRKGQCYLWSEVPGVGDRFLRQAGEKILSAALRPDLNPDAPAVVLVRHGPQRERLARLLCEQQEPVATYLKRGTNRWEYIGKYAVQKWSEERAEIRKQELCSGRDDVARIIYLKEVE